MDEIHVHKTKSICAHFAESPCNTPTRYDDRHNFSNLLYKTALSYRLTLFQFESAK